MQVNLSNKSLKGLMDDSKIVVYREKLLSWGKTYYRVYPWRQTKDPYKIIVAEFMLHRTQVVQVLKVYKPFIRHYPTLHDFSNSLRNELLEILTPLGLHWRIHGMIDSLLLLWQRYQKVPLAMDVLTSIPNIGPYIAGATICFSTNRPLALVDTNTVRVICRIFGLNTRGEVRRKKEVIDFIEQVCDPNKPRKYYYALIDLAHLLCHIKIPDCARCPIQNLPCIFSLSQMTGRIP
jgi:A/G-specific adenine glycosylase